MTNNWNELESVPYMYRYGTYMLGGPPRACVRVRVLVAVVEGSAVVQWCPDVRPSQVVMLHKVLGDLNSGPYGLDE